MIICNSRKFIFVHINKTAGTSVTDTLYPHLQWNDIILGSTPVGIALNHPYKERFGLYKHSTAREIRAVVGPEIWRDYTTFCVLRDPVDRALSLYRYLRRLQADKSEFRRRLRDLFGKGRPDWPATQALRESESFSAFIRHPKIRHDPGFMSQKAFICDPEGTVIVDRILRFETIATEFADLCGELGLAAAPIGHQNRSETGPRARPVLTPGDIAFLRAYFAEDYALLEAGAPVPQGLQKESDLRPSSG
jgi:hypothetical protein